MKKTEKTNEVEEGVACHRGPRTFHLKKKALKFESLVGFGFSVDPKHQREVVAGFQCQVNNCDEWFVTAGRAETERTGVTVDMGWTESVSEAVIEKIKEKAKHHTLVT